MVDMLPIIEKHSGKPPHRAPKPGQPGSLWLLPGQYYLEYEPVTYTLRSEEVGAAVTCFQTVRVKTVVRPDAYQQEPQ